MGRIASIFQFGNLCLYSFIFTCLLLLVKNGSFAKEDGPIVTTRNGRVRGNLLHVTVDEVCCSSVAAYLGIPYAEVPQRFAAPTEALPWDPETKSATTFGPSCYHSDDEVFPGFPGAEMWNAPNRKAEDCLYLNVWTPLKNRTSDLLPVMVWIYGGSFYSGTSALKVYEGRYLAAFGQVIVVSINYRLGPLGFMPPLDKETPSNVGLLDQNLALRWVKENIDAFGGDRNSVTVFGESAGAASIGLHAISPLSKGLFHRIILQSASQLTPWATISLEESMARAQELGRNLGCLNKDVISEKQLLKCFRAKTAEEIFNASWVTTEIFDFPFIPVHGTPYIPDHPMQMTREGRHANVDILAGYNSNEGFYFALYTIPGFSLNTSSLLTREEYIEGIKLSGLRTNELGRFAAAFMYDDWEYSDNLAKYRDALDSIIGHFHITCPVIKAAKQHSSIFPSKNVFLYHFAYRVSNNPWPVWMEVMHGYEIELVFGLPFLYPDQYSRTDRDVSRRMVQAWINFAKHGNPGFGNDVTPWPKYNAKTQMYVEISSEWNSFLTPTPHSLQCAFWENYVPALEQASGIALLNLYGSYYTLFFSTGSYCIGVLGLYAGFICSVDIDDMRLKWAIGFNRWSASMNAWESARARREHEKCDFEQTP